MHFVPYSLRLLGAVFAIAGTLAAHTAFAELTADQKQSIATVGTLLREAEARYQAGDYQTSGERLEAALDAIDALVATDDAEVIAMLSRAFPRIADTHIRLELEGVMVRPFEQPQRLTASGMEEMPQEKPATKPIGGLAQPSAEPAQPEPRARGRRRTAMPEPTAAGPSFVRDVAPILVQHCGRCHINDSQGNFNMSTFAMLAKGSPEGQVIFPGDVVASRLIETIETGDMPRGGGKVPPAQLQMLKDWILAGAKYDAPSPMIPLTAMAANAPASRPTPQQPTMDAAVRTADGDETVSFAKDIAPILLQNCNGCHIDAMQTRGGLQMDTFATLLRGGSSGEIIASTAAESLLIRKLKGEEGQRMPAGGRPPLSDEQISLISTWIEEGAAFDGESAEQPLEVMASLAWANSATDEQLNQRRMETARQKLQLLGIESDMCAEQSTERFFIIGDVSPQMIQSLAKAADRAWTKVKPFADPASIRGKVTVFAFSRRYGYSEFAKMVEQRSIPADWQSHWKQEGPDAYIAVLASSSDSDAAVEARLIGPMASLAVTSRHSDVPRWFAEGVGRAAAAKLAARELANVATWNEGLPTAVATLKDGEQLVKNGLPPEQTDLIGYAIVNTMLGRSQRRQYDALLRALEKAPSFDAAFSAAFAMDPATYIDRWKVYMTGGADNRRR